MKLLGQLPELIHSGGRAPGTARTAPCPTRRARNPTVWAKSPASPAA